MKDIYNFLDYTHDVVNSYFFFFYEKSIQDFKNASFEDEEGYIAFKGKGIGAEGKEGEIEGAFNHESNANLISSNDCIYKIERLMLETDTVGRNAIIRRVTKRIGEISCISIYAIDEMIAFAHTKEKPHYIEIVESAIIEYLRFIHGFKELCDDFDVKIGGIAEELGFNALVDLAGLEYIQESKQNTNGKRNEFTMQRKRSAILYMINELSGGLVFGSYGDIPATEIQRFVYFLTGKGTRLDNINNTSVASAFKKDDRRKDSMKQDEEFIAEYFEKIGLNKLAKKVKDGELRGIV